MEKFLPNISLKDESFTIENARHYTLSLEISYDGIAYAVFDEVKKRYILLESFNFNNVSNDSQLVINLTEIIQNCENLRLEYEKSLITFKNSKYTFIPSPLYINEEEELYLKFNQDIEKSDIIKSDLIKNINSHNIYAIPKLTEYFISENFKNISLHHHITSLIEIIIFKFKNTDENNSVFINLSQSFVDIIVLGNQKLLLCNTFNFKTGEDFIYYLMFVFEQMKLNPENTCLTIMGEIEKESALYTYIEKYIRNIVFIERNSDFLYTYQFDKIPQHYFYNLFNLKLCGL